MATITIPPLTIPSGIRQFGPVAAQAGWNTIDLTLDIATLVAPLDLILERSPDGNDPWSVIASVTALGPGTDIHGQPVTSPTFHVSLGDSNVGSQIRATVNNHGLPLVTTGGSLTVS